MREVGKRKGGTEGGALVSDKDQALLIFGISAPSSGNNKKIISIVIGT